jgi:uncharacterized protein (AIM24 family)
MATFEVIERQGLKMVKATLRNETIRAESGALHYMRGFIQMETKAPTAGGLLKSMVTGENIFRPTYTGSGEIFFGPPTFGEYTVMGLRGEAWILDRGAYVASDMGLSLDVIRNKGITGLVGMEGMFQTKVEGTGALVVFSQGPLEAVDLQNERLTVDGSFAVARQAHLQYSLQRATKSLLGSAASGEGLVSVIEGTGRVLLAPVPNLHYNMMSQLMGAIAVARPAGG